MALNHFSLIGDGAYEEVIPISSLILSKLDLERQKLGLRTLLLHIASRIHQNSDKILHNFGQNVYVNAFLRIRSYASCDSAL